MNVANGSTDSDTLRLIAIGTGFTTAGGFVQNSGVVAAESNLSNGLSIIARASTGDIRLYTGSYLEANRRITILSTGNVGIGDTSPLSLFTVGSGDKFRIDNSGNATSSGFLVVGTTAPTPNPLPAGSLFVGASATVTDRIYVGSQLSVATSTPFPGYALTVKGNAVFSGQILVDSNIIFTTDAKGLLENTSDGADNNRLVLSGGGSSATNRGALIVLNGNEYGVIGQEGELLLAAGDNGNIVFGANNSIVNNSGTWGFNTTTPGGTTGEKFTFNGNTYFQGSATLTDRLYVGSQLSVATSTPFAGASLAVSGTNAAIEAVLYLKQLILTNSRVITAQGDGLVL